MHIILGGTGHVGSATADALLERGEAVTIVTRDPAKGETWKRKGTAVAICDILDVDALRDVYRSGQRLFLLNPPAAPSTDTDVEERRTVSAIVSALEGSGLEKIVAQSTHGAQPGERCGDLTVLYELEQALAAQPIPATIMRAAYLMSNWDGQIEAIRDEGVVRTMLPADQKIPMVAPADLGQTAAHFLTEAGAAAEIHHVEGPERYSASDVASAFALALGNTVDVEVIPQEQWAEVFKGLGFSDQAAASYARMTKVTVEEAFDTPHDPMRGSVSLQDYVTDLVHGERN